MNRKPFISWANIFIENLLLCLITDLKNMADCESRELKYKMLKEDERGIWRMMELNVGPFPSPNIDYQNWIKYIHSRDEIVRKRIQDIENRLLLTGSTNADSLSEESFRKLPEEDDNKGPLRTSESPLMKTIRDGFPAIKHHLELLRKLSNYLGGITFSEETPVETIHGVIMALQKNSDEVDAIEVKRLNQVIGEMLKREDRPRREKIRAEGDVLKEIQRKLSKTFLYKNITLEEVNQMSKIVDFVERYHGNLTRLMINDSE